MQARIYGLGGRIDLENLGLGIKRLECTLVLYWQLAARMSILCSVAGNSQFVLDAM